MSDTPIVTVHSATSDTAAATAAASPAAQIVAAATTSQAFTAPDGRKFVMRWLTTLDRMKLFRTLGSDLSSNQAYLSYAMVIASVASIDGEPEPMPANVREFEALAKRLGDDVFELLEAKTIEMANKRADNKQAVEAAKN